MSFPIDKLRKGQHATVAACSYCGTLRALFGFNKTTHKFPDTGYWIDCMACGTYRYFYRIVNGRVVVEDAV